MDSNLNVMVSGIRPTGELHLGNYYGALHALEGKQERYDARFFIADLHSLTTHPKPDDLRGNVLEAARNYLAAGLDPRRCMLYAQSMLAPELAEVARTIARRFNGLYGNVFPEPRDLIENSGRVPSLSGQGKMSKSDDPASCIGLGDEPEAIEEKVRKAYSDPLRVYRSDPGHPTAEGCNVFHLHTFFTGEAEREEIAAACRAARIGCIDCKRRLAASMSRIVEPFRRSRSALSDADVLDALRLGRDKAKAVAQRTIAEVRDAIGLRML